MNGLNGLIIDGKVYEVLKGDCCDKCAFYNDVKRDAHIGETIVKPMNVISATPKP